MKGETRIPAAGVILGVIIGLAVLALAHYWHVWTALGFRYN